MQRVIYLDHNATTPVDPMVLDSMLPYFSVNYGNPSSSFHPQSWSTAGAVKNARSAVAQLISAESSEIIFTSGATESINLALRGILTLQPETTLITSNIEHPATFEVSRWASKKGFKVKYLEVEKNGLVKIESIEQALKDISGPKLLSLILAHNEIGSLYETSKLSELKKKYDFLLHWDATQALLTGHVNVQTDLVDMMSLSGHKIYGPKGVGALYLRKSTIGHQIEPLIFGGGQEFGLRSGTLNVPGIVGLGMASKCALERRDADESHFKTLFNYFFDLLDKHKIQVILNGDSHSRIFQNINITLPESYSKIELMSHLQGFCLSQGSACSSQKNQANPTLQAIGLSETQMKRTLRIGLGRNTSLENLELFVDKLRIGVY